MFKVISQEIVPGGEATRSFINTLSLKNRGFYTAPVYLFILHMKFLHLTGLFVYLCSSKFFALKWS